MKRGASVRRIMRRRRALRDRGDLPVPDRSSGWIGRRLRGTGNRSQRPRHGAYRAARSAAVALKDDRLPVSPFQIARGAD